MNFEEEQKYIADTIIKLIDYMNQRAGMARLAMLTIEDKLEISPENFQAIQTVTSLLKINKCKQAETVQEMLKTLLEITENEGMIRGADGLNYMRKEIKDDE